MGCVVYMCIGCVFAVVSSSFVYRDSRLSPMHIKIMRLWSYIYLHMCTVICVLICWDPQCRYKHGRAQIFVYDGCLCKRIYDNLTYRQLLVFVQHNRICMCGLLVTERSPVSHPLLSKDRPISSKSFTDKRTTVNTKSTTVPEHIRIYKQ